MWGIGHGSSGRGFSADQQLLRSPAKHAQMIGMFYEVLCMELHKAQRSVDVQACGTLFTGLDCEVFQSVMQKSSQASVCMHGDLCRPALEMH